MQLGQRGHVFGAGPRPTRVSRCSQPMPAPASGPSKQPKRSFSCIELRWQQRSATGVAMRAADENSELVMAGEDPETCQDAIDLGLKLTGLGRWNDALELFEKALSLPGTGIKRFRDKPRGASDREKMTCLYNIACCHSQLGDVRSGLVALAGCLELGYADFPQIRRDPDLEALRKDERFEPLMRRFEPQPGPLNSLLGGFFGGKR